jgi:Fic family protein
MSEKPKDDFWEQIDEMFSDIPKPLQDDEITAPMVGRRLKCSDHAAKKYIQEKVQAGLLESVGKRMMKNGPCEAWRMVKKKAGRG